MTEQQQQSSISVPSFSNPLLQPKGTTFLKLSYIIPMEVCLFLLYIPIQFSSVQLLSRVRDPMNRSMPGLPVHHQLPEFTQTHVHLVSDAIQPSHPLSSPSPPAPNLSQHQSLFQ